MSSPCQYIYMFLWYYLLILFIFYIYKPINGSLINLNTITDETISLIEIVCQIGNNGKFETWASSELINLPENNFTTNCAHMHFELVLRLSFLISKFISV